jgi:hypothetical protein
MKDIKINEYELTLRKLSKQDLEIIRNECATIKGGKEELKVGSYIKYICILGIAKADFYKTDYPEGMVLTERLLKARESEYYKNKITQTTYDQIYKEINDYNNIDEKQVQNSKKKP